MNPPLLAAGHCHTDRKGRRTPLLETGPAPGTLHRREVGLLSHGEPLGHGGGGGGLKAGGCGHIPGWGDQGRGWGDRTRHSGSRGARPGSHRPGQGQSTARGPAASRPGGPGVVPRQEEGGLAARKRCSGNGARLCGAWRFQGAGGAPSAGGGDGSARQTPSRSGPAATVTALSALSAETLTLTGATQACEGPGPGRAPPAPLPGPGPRPGQPVPTRPSRVEAPVPRAQV